MTTNVFNQEFQGFALSFKVHKYTFSLKFNAELGFFHSELNDKPSIELGEEQEERTNGNEIKCIAINEDKHK